MAREWSVFAVRYDRIDALPGDPPLFLAKNKQGHRAALTSLSVDMVPVPFGAFFAARAPAFPGYVPTMVRWEEAMLWAEAALDQLAGRPSDAARRAEENAARDAEEGIRDLLNFQPKGVR